MLNTERRFTRLQRAILLALPLLTLPAAQCGSGGPPPDPDPIGTWWDIECVCQDAVVVEPVQLRGCLDEDVVYPVNGATLMCNAFALTLSDPYQRVTCVASGWTETWSGDCTPRDWYLVGVGD